MKLIQDALKKKFQEFPTISLSICYQKVMSQFSHLNGSVRLLLLLRSVSVCVCVCVCVCVKWILLCAVHAWCSHDNGFTQGQVLQGHSNFVASVCILPPDDKHPQGLIGTGSNDSTILLFEPGQLEPVAKLTGHTNTGVCTPAVSVS